MKKDKAALWLSRGNLMVPNSLWGVWNREELIKLLPSPWWVMLSYLLGAVNWMTWFQVSTKEVIVVWWSLLWRFGLGHFVWSKGIAFVKKQFLWWRTHCFGALQLPKTSENCIFYQSGHSVLFSTALALWLILTSAHLQGCEMLTQFSREVYFKWHSCHRSRILMQLLESIFLPASTHTYTHPGVLSKNCNRLCRYIY